jgi:CrcB protein
MPAEPPSEQPPTDPDAGPGAPVDGSLVLAVALGGVVGAEGRYGLGVLVDHGPTAFPWATLIINVSGCLLLGVLMAVLAVVAAPRLLRPFLGVGVLGGYTTFSSFAVDADRLWNAGRWVPALGYVVGTAVLAGVAMSLGWTTTARVLR